MTTITFSHHKGGTGKTTSCLNVAGFCTLAGKKVLVVDCDPQANATAGLGINPESVQKNMYDVFMSRIEGFPQVNITDIIQKTESGIDLAPSSLDLVGAEPYLYGISSRAEVLRDALLPIKEKYDFILIDTPPSMGQFVINGLFAADHIIVTLDSGSFALNGIGPLFTIFDDMKQDLGKNLYADMAIVSRWGEGKETEFSVPDDGPKTDLISRIRSLFIPQHVPTEEEILARKEREKEHERLELMLLSVRKKFPVVYTIPYSPEIYEAQKRGMPISHVAPDGSAASAYKKIADEVMTWK
ncbi:MAG TPA: AAA family ATPase [Methanoregula sp.]|nr:AAA family ATPase [Methanoregula sp.]